MIPPLCIFILFGILKLRYAQDTRIDGICNSQPFVLLRAIVISALQRVKKQGAITPVNTSQGRPPENPEPV